MTAPHVSEPDDWDAKVREWHPNGKPEPIEWVHTRHDEPARVYVSDPDNWEDRVRARYPKGEWHEIPDGNGGMKRICLVDPMDYSPKLVEPDPSPRPALWAWAVAGVLLAFASLVWWFVLETAN